MKKYILIFLAAWVLWLLLSWSVDAPHLIIGGVCSILVSAFMGHFFDEPQSKAWQVKRYGWLFVFFCVFIGDMILAALDVLVRLLRPALRSRPVNEEVRTRLTGDYALTFFTHALTLMPATLAVDLDKTSGKVVVNYLDSADPGSETLKKRIYRYENLLANIFE